MFNGIILNYVGAHPVAELHAAQKDNLNKEKQTFKIYVLGKSIRATNYNPFGRTFIKFYESSRAQIVANFLKAEITYIEAKFSNKEIKEKIQTDIIRKIEFGVLSTLSSITRIDSFTELKGSWLVSYYDLFNTAGNVYLFLKKEKSLGLKKIYMYNGRFVEDNAARQLAIKEKISYKVYDFKELRTYYEFDNCSLHSVNENCKRARLFYKENKRKANKVANNFIKAKRSGIKTYEKSYIKNQKAGFLNFKILKNTQLISIFPSSDDEYRFLGTDWGAPIVQSQPKEIRDLIKSLCSHKYQFIVRLHPNMIDLSPNIITGYTELEKQFKNCTVLLSQDITSTYTLIDNSDYVVCFCSTVGVEASYIGKKTIGIGGSPYYKLDIVNNVNTGTRAGYLIKNNKIIRKNTEGSIIWMNYLWHYTQPNVFMNINGKNYKEAFNFRLKPSYLKRLLQSPFRLEIELKKPRKFSIITLKKWLKSFKDVIFNKNTFIN